MSHCGRTVMLDALVADELVPPVARELRQHAEHCARCRHELHWLESERALFRRRAGRDEVAHLWRDERQARQASGVRSLSRIMLLAALALVVIGYGQRSLSARLQAGTQSQALESEELMTQWKQSAPLCSRLPPGFGFHCGPGVPASFLASR